MTSSLPGSDAGALPGRTGSIFHLRRVGAAAFLRSHGSLAGWSLLIIIVIRLLFTGIMGMMPQDAYYDFYAEHLDLSYYDHPPMIAYLLRTFTTLFGKNVFALKLADTVCTWATVWMFYKLALIFLSRRLVRRAMLLLLSTLLITLVSLISTPDVPLLFFWTVSLFFLSKAVFENKVYYWPIAGLSCGLAFDAKYTAIFLLVGIAGFLLVAKKIPATAFLCLVLIFSDLFCDSHFSCCALERPPSLCVIRFPIFRPCK